MYTFLASRKLAGKNPIFSKMGPASANIIGTVVKKAINAVAETLIIRASISSRPNLLKTCQKGFCGTSIGISESSFGISLRFCGMCFVGHCRLKIFC